MRSIATGIALAATIGLLATMAFAQGAPATQPDKDFVLRYPMCSPATQPDLTATTQPDRGGESPMSLLKDAHETFSGSKNGDVGQVLGFVDPETRPLTRQAIGLLKQAADKTDQVAKVVKDKIGPTQAQQVTDLGISPGVLKEGLNSPLAAYVKDGKIDWDKVSIQQKDNLATVLFDSQPTGIFLVNRDKKWYFGSPGLADNLKETMNTQLDLFCGLIFGLDQIEQKVRDGGLTDQNFREESVKIMREAQTTAMR